jgi:transcriptional regulator of acetoin/glycerol metabolism
MSSTTNKTEAYRSPEVSAPATYTTEARLLLELLRKYKWNITSVAIELDIARSTVYRRMRKYAIVPPNDR